YPADRGARYHAHRPRHHAGRFLSGFSQAPASRRCRQTGAVAPPRRRLLLAVAAGLALADASIVTLALPRLLSELHATVEGVAAVIGVYTVVLAAALLP